MQSPSPTGPNRLVYLVKVPYLARGTAALAAATVLGAVLASPADAAELRSAAPSSSTASSTPTGSSSTSTSTPISSGTTPSEPSTMSTMSVPSSTASAPSSTTSSSTASPSPTPASEDAVVGEVVSVESFGADGTDEVDDTAALEEALGAIEPGQVLDFGDGLNFLVAGVLSVTTDGVTLSGESTITSTNEQQSSFRLAADDVTVEDLTFDTAGVTKRWDAYEQQRLHIDGGSGVTLDGVTSRGSAAAGIYVGGGASDVLLQDFTVEDSQTDGIHITQGASDVTVASPQVTNSGDDGGAVVSYAQDGDPVTNVAFTDAVIDGTNARGLSVVGGTDVSFTGFAVSDTAAAGLYIASEGEWGTTGVDGVTASGGTITGANTDEATDHGAVLVYDSTSQAVTDVLVEDLTITDTRESASRQIGVLAGEPDAITDVTITDVTITGGPEQTLGLDDPDQAVAITGVTQDGAAVADVGTPSGDAGADTTPTGTDTSTGTDTDTDTEAGTDSSTGNGAVSPTTPRPTPTTTDDTAEEESAASPDEEEATPGDDEPVTQDEAFEALVEEFIAWWGARGGADDVDTERAGAAASDAEDQEQGLVDPAEADLPAPTDVGGDDTPASSSDPTPATGAGSSSSTSGSADDTDTTTGQTAAGNPFAAGHPYVETDPGEPVAVAAAEATDPAEEAALTHLAEEGSAIWLGGTPEETTATVARVSATAREAGQTPTFVAYNIVGRDCSGGLSAGGAGSADKYRSWVQALAAGLDGGAAAVVLEPDALADLDCLAGEQQDQRLTLLGEATGTLTGAGASVYLDAGHAGWQPAPVMAERLSAAGVDGARGFSLNVSHFQTTEASTAYGDQIAEALGGDARYVVDTSRNGSGAPADGQWCNPAGITVGQTFTTDTASPSADAYLWVKTPGYSDGACNGAPAAGGFSLEQAIALATPATETADTAPAPTAPAASPAPAN